MASLLRISFSKSASLEIVDDAVGKLKVMYNFDVMIFQFEFLKSNCCHYLCFFIFNLKPAFLLVSLTVLMSIFKSSKVSLISVVSFAYLKLFIILLLLLFLVSYLFQLFSLCSPCKD